MPNGDPALIQRINALEAALATAEARAVGDAAQITQLTLQLNDVEDQAATIQRLQARVTELERLLAPAASGIDVLTVLYSDGRVKYAAPDGSKYPIPADAQHRAKVLALMKIGLGEVAAETMLQHADETIRALTS